MPSTRLDELDEDATAVLRMGEIHEGTRGARLGLLVQHPHTCGAQASSSVLHIVDAEGHLLNPRTLALEESADR